MREVADASVSEVTAHSLHEVVFAHFAFDVPVFVHSGVGVFSFEGNAYLGIGHLGSISDTRESELLGPGPLTLTLSGVDAVYLQEALTAGRYGDVVRIYVGYRGDDGLLVATPWLAWRGWFEFASVRHGEENTVQVTVQHDLANLEEADRSRFSDEDQQRVYAGDLGFEFVAEMGDIELLWGDKPIGGATSGGRGSRPGRRGRGEYYR